MVERRVRFAVDRNTGMVYSRVGDRVAVPVPLDTGIRLKGSTEPQYSLEPFPVYAIRHKWANLHSTQRIPMHIQNVHREFWRLPKLASAPPSEENEGVSEG